jgi:flagellar assembly protein FliH
MGKNTSDLEIEEFSFPEFNGAANAGKEAKDFLFRELADIQAKTPERAHIIKAERDRAEKSGFSISPIVREYRGITKQEVDEKEKRIEDEIQKRLEFLRDQAVQEGYQEGIELGKAEIFDQTRQMTEEKLTHLTGMIEMLLREKEELLAKEKNEVYRLIRNLSKWVVLRELKDDGAYLERLLEKLITELGSKQSLLIQVNRNQFDSMPEVLEIVEKRLGQLRNVRIESDLAVSENGFIIESENGIINGTLEEQFHQLDRLFETVGLENDE